MMTKQELIERMLREMPFEKMTHILMQDDTICIRSMEDGLEIYGKLEGAIDFIYKGELTQK